MSELDALAIKFNSDKRTGQNGYTPTYERYLSTWRTRPFRLLEIGVYRGASLRMWETYFPHADIIGLDIDDTCAAIEFERARVIIGNQSKPKMLHSLGAFDVVIDDGSHVCNDQIASFMALFPSVLPGGLYFIEDVHVGLTAHYMSKGRSIIDYLTQVIGEMNHNGREHWGERKTGDQIAYVHFWPGLAVIGRAA